MDKKFIIQPSQPKSDDWLDVLLHEYGVHITPHTENKPWVGGIEDDCK